MISSVVSEVILNLSPFANTFPLLLHIFRYTVLLKTGLATVTVHVLLAFKTSLLFGLKSSCITVFRKAAFNNKLSRRQIKQRSI